MKVIADTNILVRAIADDDPVQSPLAQAHLENSELVALTLPALCELAWVFLRLYKRSRDELAQALQTLIATENVSVDRAAVEAGLTFLVQDGDFADGVIAHNGLALGGQTFLSFDRNAVQLLQQRGKAAVIPT